MFGNSTDNGFDRLCHLGVSVDSTHLGRGQVAAKANTAVSIEHMYRRLPSDTIAFMGGVSLEQTLESGVSANPRCIFNPKTGE